MTALSVAVPVVVSAAVASSTLPAVVSDAALTTASTLPVVTVPTVVMDDCVKCSSAEKFVSWSWSARLTIEATSAFLTVLVALISLISSSSSVAGVPRSPVPLISTESGGR